MAENDFTLTKDYLHQIFEYKDGELFRLKNGKKVGSNHIKGYKHTAIKGKKYLLHRLIYMMFNGYFPKEIDHINGNRLDSRIQNLRSVTGSQNQQNSKIRKDNKSGIKGVYWFKELKKWKIDIRFNGKRKYIGVFEDLELAELVAIEARDKYHGKFARHN